LCLLPDNQIGSDISGKIHSLLIMAVHADA